MDIRFPTLPVAELQRHQARQLTLICDCPLLKAHPASCVSRHSPRRLPSSHALAHTVEELTGTRSLSMTCRWQAGVNALAWAPHSSCHICTAGDDSQALIWDLSSMSQPLDQGLGARFALAVFDLLVGYADRHPFRMCPENLLQVHNLHRAPSWLPCKN